MLSLIYIYVKYRKHDHLNQTKGALWCDVLFGLKKMTCDLQIKGVF